MYGQRSSFQYWEKVCTVRISGDFRGYPVLFKTHAFGLGDLFIFLSVTRAPLSIQSGHAISKRKVETDSTERNGILAVDICMVLSGMGTELLTERFLWQDKHSLYCLYSRNLSVICDNYIDKLNASYTDVTSIDEPLVCRESITRIQPNQRYAGDTPSPSSSPRVKTMLIHLSFPWSVFTGSMGPFFCEFTLNGDLLPPQYPATYAHELAHFLGITSGQKPTFTTQVCTRSQVKERFVSGGYFSVLPHVLGNACRLMSEEEYAELFNRIRPEIIELAQKNQQYWMEKHSPPHRDIQNFIYDLYL